ncbi:unnamed protein product [Sphagnum troendelagicum]
MSRGGGLIDRSIGTPEEQQTFGGDLFAFSVELMMRLLSTGWLKHHRPAFDRARSVTTRAQSFSISDGVRSLEWRQQKQPPFVVINLYSTESGCYDTFLYHCERLLLVALVPLNPPAVDVELRCSFSFFEFDNSRRQTLI